MNAATEFDLGPLTWVKSEIDLALERAEEALAQFSAAADITRFKLCRTHVHQVHGALSMVGLDGLTQVTESLEAALLALEEGRQPADEASVAVLHQVLAALRQYLDDLMAGEANQPLRLLPIYLLLEGIGGSARAQASDLFFPDLSLRPPRREATDRFPAPGELRKVLKSERMRYQKGLLSWLKRPQEAEAGRQLMLDALTRIEETQETPAARSFWWTARAFIEALADPTIRVASDINQISSRIDLQIRRLLEGSNNVAERLMRAALYHVARAPAELTPLVAEVQSTFALPALMPQGVQSAGQLPCDAVLRRLREALVATEELWNKVCIGSLASLPGFAEHARNVAALTGEIGHTDLKRLGQGLGAIAAWLLEDGKRYSDTVAMEVATAILLLESAQERFKHLGTDFAQQVDLMVARLYACISGQVAASEGGIPLLDEMTRRAQEKLLVGQVAREIQNNLAQVEQALDGFFRDPAKGHDLSALEAPLKQIGGALAMLGHLGAAASLKTCGEHIRRFAEADYSPTHDDFEVVARELSVLGFFVDALPSGEHDFAAFSQRLQSEFDAARGETEEESLPVSVEAQLAQQARDTQALVKALKDAPEDSRLHAELKQNLQALQKDADLVDDQALGETAKAALAALQSGDVANVDASSLVRQQQAGAAPEPSASTLQLSQSSHEEIDAELLAIFLEEAVEVLATIREQLDLLASEPHDIEALTTIRRSVHTLKGSGRMVGLKDLGETAWELEQTLNLWLRQDQAATPELLGMINDGYELFAVWIQHLESGELAVPDTQELVALAVCLRGMDNPLSVTQIAIPRVADATEPATIEEPAIEFSPVMEDVPIVEEALVVEEAPVPDEPEPTEETALNLSVDFSLPDEPGERSSIELDMPFLGALETQESAESVPPTDEPAAPATIDFKELEAEPEIKLEVEGQAETPAESLAPVLAEEPPLSTVTAAPTLYDIFREEARGHLQTLLDSYGELEANLAAPTTFEMTRAAHTLGGIAATVGLMPLNHLAIALEHALLRRDGSAHPESIEGLETVRQSIMTLEQMFDALAEQQAPVEQQQLIGALEEIYLHPPVVESAATVSPAETPSSPETAVEPVSLPEIVAPQLPQLTDELDEQLLPIFLEEANDQLRDLTAQLRAWKTDLLGSEPPQAISRLLHTFKGNARMAGAMNLGELTHLLETRVQDVVRAGPPTPGFIDEIENGCDTLAQAIERLREGPQEVAAASAEPLADADADGAPPEQAVASSGEAEPEAEAGGLRATLRVRADLIDRLVNEAGELSIARARIEGEMRSLKGSLLELTENVIRLRRQLREIEIQAEGQIQARFAQSPEGEARFDPLELDRFTRFQELTRFMAESVNDVATVQQNLLKNLDDANAAILAQSRLNRSLQQDLMGVRMIPFASQAERLYRIVRQTAKAVDKRANLDIVGGQVEMDRSVLDKILAPLEHMLRNAVTHGIEHQADRQAVGKHEVGEISLALAQEGNEIVLTMADDGKGLDAARIRARAEEMGLLLPGQVIEDTALFDYIFRPGFSTAEELTQVAGRGVGMDVVKTEVTALGGRIEIQSQPGRGTTFRLYLPLTLAVTQTLLIRAGTQLYAVPSTMIEQVQELKDKSLAILQEKGFAEWQNNRYPLHYLSHLLGDRNAVPEVRRRHWVLLLRSGSQRIAVQIDELKGNQEVVVKNIGAQLARVAGIDGATVLADGQVILILNPVALASSLPVAAAQQLAPPVLVEENAVALRPTVMVVDDSLTVRKITSRLLIREGYEVVLAKDGVDALEQLIEVMPDVILSDIEMPRMDGFDLLRNIRSDERLKHLPVIMITSRTADKHRNYAEEIGANHYLGKPYDEVELLRLVAGYVQAKVAN